MLHTNNEVVNRCLGILQPVMLLSIPYIIICNVYTALHLSKYKRYSYFFCVIFDIVPGNIKSGQLIKRYRQMSAAVMTFLKRKRRTWAEERSGSDEDEFGPAIQQSINYWSLTYTGNNVMISKQNLFMASMYVLQRKTNPHFSIQWETILDTVHYFIST